MGIGINYPGGAGADGKIIISYVPGYRAELSDPQFGSSSIWYTGEKRTVSVNIKNTGQATWNNDDVVLKVKWNNEFEFVVEPNGLASGSENVFSFDVTAPSFQGEENLTFVVERNEDEIAKLPTGNLNIVPSVEKYYSYRTGNWNEPTTWTHDPSGTTQVCETVPNNYSEVTILSGRTVSLSENVSANNLQLTVAAGGILDMKTSQLSSALAEFKGQGTLRLASVNFPSVTNNTFVATGGGTTEYYNSSSFTLPTTQDVYNNLSIATGSAVATQMSNIVLNGDLHVKSGTFRINDDTSTAKKSLTILGNVTVNSGASLTVGKGKTNVNNSTNITGGTAPFLNYYTNFHTVIVKGDFTNKGTVRFTNLDYPIFNKFPSDTGKTGAATVYFQGATNNRLTCNGTTDFYNLVLDKGLDQTYKLTVYSSAYKNFRLFGANNSGGDSPGPNPNLKKALWIRTGTLELTGLTVIPSLSEGGGGGVPNSDFYIPVNAALVLNGPDVIVLGTADKYEEINAAYGVNGGTDNSNGVNVGTQASSFSVYGKFQVIDGYFSTRESGGIITWDQASGQVEIFGGYVDIKQFRAASDEGMSGLASYNQTGGTLALRGRFQRQPANYTSPASLKATAISTINTAHSTTGLDGSKGIFNINAESNVFMMSGGAIQVYDVNDGVGGAIEIKSSPNNINVTGGTVELYPTTGGDQFKIRTTAPFGNLLINRSGGNSIVSVAENSLTILKDVTVTSGELRTNNLDVTVGGNFSLGASGTYNSGTNTTLFNGAGNQVLTNNGTINNGAVGLNNLSINKSAGFLRLAGSNPLTVRGDLNLTKGILDDGGKTLTVLGNITNSGVHQGAGAIKMQGTALQTIGGDGKGVFKNIILNNNNSAAAPVSLTSNMVMNGLLTFEADRQLNIGTHNLKMGASASFSTNVGTNRYVRSAGNAGDGGVTLTYDSPAARTFPVGVNSYTPAVLGFTSAPSTYGTITVVQVNYKHPVTKNNNALNYFFRIKSSGITGYAGKVTHKFTVNNTISYGGNPTSFVPAFYNPVAFEWNYGQTSNINIGAFTLNDWTTPTQSDKFLDGDYTAGEIGAFAKPDKFYSRQTGRWNQTSTWSTTSHTAGSATRTPGSSDVVIVGDNHTVTLNANAYSASLQIAERGILDVAIYSGSDFGMVSSHHSGENGLIKIAAAYSGGSTFVFPNGDFSEFNAKLGTTELYTTNSTAGTTYWLPNNIDNYGNLILSPLGGSNIIFGNTDVTIYGDLTTKGQNSESWYCPTWVDNYPTAPTGKRAKKITIQGDFDLQGGALIYYGNNNLAQDLVIHGDLKIAQNSGVKVYGNATNQSIEIGGSLINNASSPTSGVNAYRGADFTNIPLTFFGNSNASISNSSGTPYTKLDKVTINKGASPATKLTIDIAGALNTPADNWLTFENGTLEYKRTNPSSDFTITTSTPLTIPASAGLWVESSAASNVLIANANSNNNDLFLNGKLTVVNGNVYVGPTGSPNNNNDIEYAGGGASSIEVRGGKLVVNGQIRRNPATTSGILSYVQSGGEVVINGQNNISTNAKLEVLNDGSKFNMSGGTLTIVRGGGGNAYGDLFLRPESSLVTGGTITFAHNLNGNMQSYLLDANVPLNNLTITGRTAGTGTNASVQLLVSPLTLKGNLTLSNANSIFDANSEFNIPLTIKGDFVNNGTYNPHSNLTTFSGGTQKLTGSSSTSFYDLKVNPVTSFTIERNVAVARDLELASGTFTVNTHSVTVARHLKNNATYASAATSGGIILSGGAAEHQISGTGTFDRLELNSSYGARIYNEITMRGSLILTQGVLNINQYLLTLGEFAEIEGSNFGTSKMISSDGVYSNIGIKKLFPNSTTARTFVYPMGIAGKYTPAELIIGSNGNAGYVRINTVDARHPSAQSPYRVLDYYWDVESTGISGFNGALKLHYDDKDIKLLPADEANYIAARLLTPGTTWQKATSGSSTDNVEEASNTILFTFTGSNNLNGEYTAGLDSDIPAEVPTYVTNKSGNWSDPTIWSPESPEGGPNGVVVVINHEVTLDKDYCFAYRTTINDKLKVDKAHFGHNLGTIKGNGTLYLESALMPAGRYSEFLDCGGDATLEFGGSGDYNIVADLFTSLPNLKISGTGSRILPNEELTICKRLTIDGATLDNSVNNKSLVVKGTMERLNNGVFKAGTGAQATVRFAGDASQTLGGALGCFTGNSAFNNLEIDNPFGLTLACPTEISGKLMLTNGVIYSSSYALLTIVNTAPNNTVSPAGGLSTSYVDGPMVKRINQGDTFLFPIGKAGVLGNKLQLSASQTGTIDWSAEYFTPNDTYASYETPLTYVNSKEKWALSAPEGSQARVSINWDASSDVTPLVTVSGVIDLKVAKYNTADLKWNEITSGATGNNNNGTITTTGRLIIPSSGSVEVTSATVNTVKAKAKLTPSSVICGENSGIPVTFTSSEAITLPYSLTYSLDGVLQTAVSVSTLPYSLPTTAAGEYQLIGFKHNNGTREGVVDQTVVTVFATPTTPKAGSDQSLCGATSVTLAANDPSIGVGLWSIVSGTGGTVVDPTIPTSVFNGTNGSAYTLRWSISNGECESSDDVKIVFPLLAAQPGEFTDYDTDVCGGTQDVIYTVPNDATVTYAWSYSGAGVTMSGSGNSIKLTFANDATSGTLSVTATNGCNTSTPRELAIVVNPVTPIILEADSEEVCASSSVTFIATLGASYYNFFVDNISEQNSTSNTYTVSGLTSGEKTVSVVATNDKGCKVSSNEVTITVISTPGLWTGSKDSNWNDGANWCDGSVPESDINLVIPSKMVNQPVITGECGEVFAKNLTIETGAALTLNPGGKLTVNGDLTITDVGGLIMRNTTAVNGLASLMTKGNISGDARIELEFPYDEWYYVSQPIANAQSDIYAVLNADDSFNTAEAWINVHRANRWYRIGSGVGLADFEGVSNKYRPADNSNHIVSYTGKLNNGSIAKSYANRQYYLFGNPYPSAINWQEDAGWERNNIGGTIWYRTRVKGEMAFVTYNRYAGPGSRAAIYPDQGTFGNDESMLGYIPPLQSVWITSLGSSSVSINNDSRSHTSDGSFLKSSSSERSKDDVIRIIIENAHSYDGAVLYFSENSDDGIDRGDSEKMFNESVNIPEIYTRSAGKPLAINGLSTLEGALELPLSVRNRVEGTVDMKFDLSLYRSDDVILLHDTFLDAEINLRKVSQYRYEPFNLGDTHNRFVIRFNPEGYEEEDVSTPVDENVKDNAEHLINIVGYNGRAIVSVDRELLQKEPGKIEVFNTAGGKISEFKAKTNKTFIVLPETSGVYLVVVKAGGKMKSEKLVR